MEFRILGIVEVQDQDGSLSLGGPKPLALLTHLVLEAGRSVPREHLVDELWGDDPPPTAQDSLNVHIARLRRALGARLHTTPSGYMLEAADEEVDASRFEAGVAAARAPGDDPAITAAALREALSLWRGPVFGGLRVGPTAAAAAVRLEELRASALEDRVEADLALGRHAELISELTGLVAASPTRERLAGQLMLALHRCGRSADALSVHAAAARILEEQLGVDPGDALTALSRAIHRDDPGLAAPGPSSLPVSAGRFVGRRDELHEVGALLAGARLLTLTGLGGCGKTRLAVELARAAAPDHPGGVHLVDLASLPASASVARQVAAVLGVRERRGEPLTSSLAARLRHHRTLLVLDNCEHVIHACAQLCDSLLGAAVGLRVLATSREPLGISGEVVFAVPGLSLPDVEGSADTVSASDAVRLLVDRASAARTGFRLTGNDAVVAGALCRRLDGLPLAIELAAARMRTLSLVDVAARLEQRLDVEGGSRAVHARHQTMNAAIEWSHELLGESERIALRRLSVFAGGLGSAGADAVVGGWAPLNDETDVTDLCCRLADKSMLVAETGPGGIRFRMLEVVRQFAQSRLEAAGETVEAQSRHAGFYHDLVPEARVWGGPEQLLWLDRIDAENANVRMALGWYLGEGWEPQRALKMAGPLWWFWYMRGLLGEGRAWLQRALAATPAEATGERALALRAVAALARIMGDHAEAVRQSEESLLLYRELGDERGVAAALNSLCVNCMASGDLDSARRYGEESLAAIERLGEPQGMATSRNNLGLVTRIEGDLDRAAALFEAARVGWTATGDRRGMAAALTNLAIVARRRGETSRVRALAIDALTIYNEMGFDEGKLDCLEVLAAQGANEGRGEMALQLLTVTARMRDTLSAPLFVADEQAQRVDAEQRARMLLGDAVADGIVAAADELSLAEAVDSVLRAEVTAA